MKKGRKISYFFRFLVEKFALFTVYIVDRTKAKFRLAKTNFKPHKGKRFSTSKSKPFDSANSHSCSHSKHSV